MANPFMKAGYHHVMSNGVIPAVSKQVANKQWK